MSHKKDTRLILVNVLLTHALYFRHKVLFMITTEAPCQNGQYPQPPRGGTLAKYLSCIMLLLFTLIHTTNVVKEGQGMGILFRAMLNFHIFILFFTFLIILAGYAAFLGEWGCKQ